MIYVNNAEERLLAEQSMKILVASGIMARALCARVCAYARSSMCLVELSCFVLFIPAHTHAYKHARAHTHRYLW